MKKLLLVTMLVVGFCLAAVVGHCASWTDKDVKTITGRTGYARLDVDEMTFRFTHKIQPGERLAVKWYIRNTGPCPLNVTVTVSGPTWLDIVFWSGGSGFSFQMGPASRKQVALTVALPAGSTDWTANREFTIKVTFDSVEAGQYNAPDPF